MAKNKPAKVSKVDPSIIARTAIDKASDTAKVSAAIGVRGLKGIPVTAKITVLAASNPKRAGCAAYDRYALYRDGLTQEEFLAAGGTTPDLAYDTKHGFIAVEGYSPELVVKKERAVKEPKAPRTAKGGKAKAAPNPDAEAAAADMAAQTREETID